MSKYPSIPDPGSNDQGLQATVRALRQAVNLLTGAAGDSSTKAVTHEGVKSSVDYAINKVFKPDLQTLDGAIAEANIARAAAFAELDKALSELANGQSSSTLQGQINNIGVATDNAAAAIVDERAARINSDDALAGQITALTATVNNNTAAIVNESVVRSQQDNSIAATVSTLTSTANRAVSYIQGTQPTGGQLKVGDLWVNTSQGNSLFRWNGSTWDNVDNNAIAQNSAAITNEQTARTTAVSALANTVSTLTTRVDNNTSSISTQASSLNGVLAQYTITGTINGQTGKFSFGGVQKADGSVSFGAEIQGSLVVTGSITGDKVGANQINGTHVQAQSLDASKIVAGSLTSDSGVFGLASVRALNLEDNAVTVPLVQYFSRTSAVNNTTITLYNGSLTINTTGLNGKLIPVFCFIVLALDTSVSGVPSSNPQGFLYMNGQPVMSSGVTMSGSSGLYTLPLSGVIYMFGNGGTISCPILLQYNGGVAGGANQGLGISGGVLYAQAGRR